MNTVTIARRLRREATDAEQKLWSRLRGGRFRGLKFRRQMPIYGFVADFACVAARLVIEIDGGQHADRIAEDYARSAKIEAAGFLVVRFWNHDVLGDVDAVLAEIGRVLDGRG